MEGRKANDLPGLTVRINIISFNLVTIYYFFPPSVWTFWQVLGTELGRYWTTIEKDTSTTTKQQTQTPDSPSPFTSANITTDYVMNQLLTPLHPGQRTSLHVRQLWKPLQTSPLRPLTAANITTEYVLNALFPDSPLPHPAQTHLYTTPSTIN